MAGAIACAKHFGIKDDDIKSGLEKIEFIRGRMEKVDMGQNFDVVVDYAHTPDSLQAIYEAFAPRLTAKTVGAPTSSQEKNTPKKLICILGNTGGGRDTWKRPEMAKIADEYCDHIIFTNEDPYDEDPMKIINEMKVAVKNKPYEIILDRRAAIASAISQASHFAKASRDDQNKVAVLITGKGTDPYIMGPNGSKQEWDDAKVVREELQKIIESQNNLKQ